MICFLHRKKISKQSLFFSIPPFLYDDEELLFGSFLIDRFCIEETNSLMEIQGKQGSTLLSHELSIQALLLLPE
jgi:hypothetical protein